MLNNIEICDHFIYYLLIGLAYSIVIEIQYRREDRMVEYDANVEYWFWGDLFQMLMLGALNTLFWPKSITDEMIDAYLYTRANEEEDD